VCAYLLPDYNNEVRISAVGTPPAKAGLHTQQRRKLIDAFIIKKQLQQMAS
jgi:hypothetical protein